MENKPCRCPQKWSRATLGEVESAYRDGRISQDDFDAYRCSWQRSAPRFGDYYFAHDHCKESKEWQPLDQVQP